MQCVAIGGMVGITSRRGGNRAGPCSIPVVQPQEAARPLPPPPQVASCRPWAAPLPLVLLLDMRSTWQALLVVVQPVAAQRGLKAPGCTTWSGAFLNAPLFGAACKLDERRQECKARC